MAAMLEEYKRVLFDYRDQVDDYLGSFQSTSLVLAVFLIALFGQKLVDILVMVYYGDLELKNRFISFIKKVPIVRKRIEMEKRKRMADIIKSFDEAQIGLSNFQRLPERGLDDNALLKQLDQHKAVADKAVDWQSGRVSGAVYSPGKTLTDLMTKVFSMFMWTNPLHYDAFPDIRKFESEIVSMVLRIYNAPPTGCGSVTSGGTESLVLACLAYREVARKKGVDVPEMILPVTAHVAFRKAAHMFGMKVRECRVDGRSFRADVSQVRSLINSSTCMLVASAPGYPYGVIDDVEEIAALGARYGIPTHVDCCLGGFMLPFLHRAGFDVRPFDFRVPGVTSISCDTHKYGMTPKGSSVLMFSHPYYRRQHFYGYSSWPGGLYATATIGGSRAGVNIAACWATLLHFGMDGYVLHARLIMEIVQRMKDAIRNTEGLYLLGDSDACVVAWSSLDFDIFLFFQEMSKLGWKLAALQFPSGVHLAVTVLHTQPGVCDRLIEDIRSVAARLLISGGKPSGSAALYGTAQTIPDRSLVDEMTVMYIEAALGTSHQVDTLTSSNGYPSASSRPPLTECVANGDI